MNNLFRRTGMVCIFLIASFQLGACGSGSASGSGRSLDFVDFIDNTENYKGQNIQLTMIVASPIWLAKGQSLRNYSGKSVEFMAFEPGSGAKIRLDIVVDIPAGLSVPKVGNGAKVEVSFVSKDGNLQYGNEAVSIARP